MNHEQNVTEELQALTVEQLELLPTLVEGVDPDVYLVVPIGLLSRQVNLSATAIARRHRGEVKPGAFAVHLIRALQSVGVLVDTMHQGNGMDQVRS